MDNSINPRLAFFQSQIGHDMSSSISAIGRLLNGTLRVADSNLFVADYTVRPDLANPSGVLHGGMAAAILDDLIGTMVFALNREFAYVSVNLNVDYLHAARIGEVITARAEIIRPGRNIIHCEGRIVSADGKIIAKCAANLIQTSLKVSV